MNTKIVEDRIVKEGDYWVVYRYSDTWDKCPIFKTKDKKLAKILLK